MLKEKVRPTVITLTNVVSACARAKQFDEVLKSLELFKKMGIKPNHITYLFFHYYYFFRSLTGGIYTALVDQLGKNKQIDEAEAVMEAMMKDGIKPPLMAYNSLMDGFGEAGQLKKMMDTFINIRKRGLIPDVVSYSIMIKHYGKAGDVEKALEMARIMTKEGRKPNNTMYTTMVSHLVRCFFFFFSLFLPLSFPIILFFVSLFVFPLLIHKPFDHGEIAALGQNGKPKEAIQLLHKMIDTGLEPNVKTFGVLIQSLCANGLLDDAIGILNIMIDRKVTMDAG